MASGILLFGASQRTGLEVARILATRGESLTAVVRPSTDKAELEKLGVNCLTADLLDADSVANIFSSGSFRAVISTFGGSRSDATRPDFVGNRNIATAALAHDVRRMVLVTMIGAGASEAAVSDNVKKFLGPIMELKTQAEEFVMASGLDVTILRPGGMRSDPATGTAIRTEDQSLMGMIHRADLARLVVECLDDDTSIGKIFHTIDPEIKEEAPLQRGEKPRFDGAKP